MEQRIADINDMRINIQKINKSATYAKLEKNITGSFIHNVDSEGKITCECGKKIYEYRIKRHLKSKDHNEWVKSFLNKELEKPHKYTDYICTHGIYKGYKLEDVIYTDPKYIDFLIREYKDTFPKDFEDALKKCGLKF